jgi:hypothetical protein
VVFLRAHSEQAVLKLREIAGRGQDENQYLADAARAIAEFLSADRVELISEPEAGATDGASAVLDPAARRLQPWVRALAPLRFSRGDAHLLVLGARAGGRRYLSEDIEVLERLATIVCEQVERMRNAELQALVSQAELRALQAQINPHFLFNSLNSIAALTTVDGARAREMCIKLSDFLRSTLGLREKNSITLREELALAKAYLDVEQVRFAARLRVEFDSHADCNDCIVPPLFLQPLVENAVKHGIAGLVDGGTIRVETRCRDGRLRVKVENEYDPDAPAVRRHGLGLQNVRSRLRAAYENQARIDTSAADNRFVVEVELPCAAHG